MTTFEQKRAFEILSKKSKDQGQRITNHQSGWIEQFGDVGGGRVNRVGVPEELPQGDEQSIAEAISYVQKIAETYPDDFAKWATGANILNKAGEGDSVRKATINRSGQTQDPVSYPANQIGSTPGAGKTVMTSQLSKLVADAENLLFQARMHEGHLKAKILHVSKL